MKIFAIIFSFTLLGGLQVWGQTWDMVQRFASPDSNLQEEFGHSVSIYDDYALVGAPGDQEDVNGQNPIINDPGSAFFFERGANERWTMTQKVVASDRTGGMRFGYQVALFDKMAAISLPGWNDGSTYGRVDIFERLSGGNWVEIQKLPKPDAHHTRFGKAIALNDTWLVIGDDYEGFDANGQNELNNAGAVYCYQWQASSWVFQQKIVPTDRIQDDLFGWAVALDDNRLVVGSPGKDGEKGAVYTFEWNGTTWTQMAKLLPSDHQGEMAFGYSVDTEDGVIAIGVGDLPPGAIYLFEKDNNGNWLESQKLSPDDLTDTKDLGFSVAIDGPVLLGGVRILSLTATNLVGPQFFEKKNAIWTNHQQILYPGVTLGLGGTLRFGRDVDVSGSFAIIANPTEPLFKTPTSTITAGAVYFYKRSWTVSQDQDPIPLSIRVFPNPGRNEVWITGDLTGLRVTIQDPYGRYITKEPLSGHRQVIRMDGTASGVFTIQVFDQAGRQIVRKWIRQPAW